MHLSVVFDFLITLARDFGPVLEREHVGRVLEVFFLHEHALERFGIEAERGAALQALLVRVEIDVLERVVLEVRRHVRGLRDRGIDPLLRGGLDVHVLGRRDVVRSREVLGQLLGRVRGTRHRARVDDLAIGQQLEREDVDFLLALLAFADHVAEIVMREGRLDAVAGIVRQRQRDRAGRSDRGVVREARAHGGELLDQLRRHFGHALHVAAIAGMQEPARHLGAHLPAVARHLRSLAQHLAGDGELLIHDRRRALLAGQIERGFPAGDGHFARHVFGEADRLGRAVLHAEQRHRAAEAEEAHAMAALAHDFVALLRQRQAVDLDHIVQHAREDLDDLAVLGPVELGEFRERIADETREVHRAQQA